MIDYFKLLNIDQNLSLEEIQVYLHEELRTWTSRSSHPIKEKRDLAEEKIQQINEAMPFFESQEKYNQYILQLEQSKKQAQEQQKKAQPKANNNQALSVDQALEKARTLIGYNNQQALKYINDCIAVEPNNIKCWQMLGYYYRQTDNTDEAVKVYYKGLTVKPNDYLICFNLFTIFCYKSDAAGARDMFNVLYAPIKNKNDAYAHYIKGKYNMTTGKYNIAIKELKEADRILNGQNQVSTELEVEPYNFLVTDLNLNVYIANAYYNKCSWFTVKTSKGNYLTTKADVYDYISCMEKAISYDPRDEYKNYLEIAKGTLKNKENAGGILKVIPALIIIYIGESLYLKYKLGPWYLFVTLYLAYKLPKELMKVREYLANGARIAGRKKIFWAIKSKLFGERRPKVRGEYL